MPRIFTSDSDALDFCKRCFPSEDEAIELYKNFNNEFEEDDENNNFEVDSFSYDETHPPYEQDIYYCATCGIELIKKDN